MAVELDREQINYLLTTVHCVPSRKVSVSNYLGSTAALKPRLLIRHRIEPHVPVHPSPPLPPPSSSLDTWCYPTVPEIPLPYLNLLPKFLFAPFPFEVVPFGMDAAIPAGFP